MRRPVRLCSIHEKKPSRCRGTPAEHIHLLIEGAPGGSLCIMCGKCCERMEVKLRDIEIPRIIGAINEKRAELQNRGVEVDRLIGFIKAKKKLPTIKKVARDKSKALKTAGGRDACVFLVKKP